MHAPSQGASAFACKPQQVMPQRELWHFLFFLGGGRMLLRLRLCLKRYGGLAYRCIAECHKAYVAHMWQHPRSRVITKACSARVFPAICAERAKLYPGLSCFAFTLCLLRGRQNEYCIFSV